MDAVGFRFVRLARDVHLSAERDVRVRLRQVHDLSRTSESVDEASRFGDAEICNGRLPDEVKELLWLVVSRQSRVRGGCERA